MAHLKELALFAGAGGGILGGKLLGWRTVCAVEIDAYCREVLMRRQDEGYLEAFPIWDDVRTFDGTEWRGRVDVVSGGFPCQDISVAGKGDGLDGERSGLWREMARIIGEVRPRFAFVENSPALVRRGLDTVLGDLAGMGFDARWGIISAADLRAPHQRKRLWILADSDSERLRRGRHSEVAGAARAVRGEAREQRIRTDAEPSGAVVAHAASNGRKPRRASNTQEGAQRRELDRSGHGCTVPDADDFGQLQPEGRQRDERGWLGDCGWWPPEPDVGRVANGVAHRVDRLSALGNGQVSRVAAAAWRILGGP